MADAPDFERDSQHEREAEFVASRRRAAQEDACAAAILADAFDELMASSYALDSAAHNSLIASFAVTAGMSESAVAAMMNVGWSVRHTFTVTGAAFAAGEITLQHARHIVEEACAIAQDAEAVAAYEAEIVAYAMSTTPRRTQSRAKQLVAVIDRQNVVERHRAARERRHVRLTDAGDGMGEYTVLAPMILARAMFERTTAIAKAIEAVRDEAVSPDGERDERTRDQIRADASCDLVLGAAAETLLGTGLEAIRATVNVTISAKTLAGFDNNPAEHDGFGPLDPEFAKELASKNQVWTKLFLDHNAQIVSTSSYAPTAEMRRTIQARDTHCRFPGCRVPVARCEIDHTHDAAKGGKTELCNLSCLCTRHHPLKHPNVPDEFRWKVWQVRPGVLKWQSPSGRVYIDEPESRVMFVEQPPPPRPADPWLADEWAYENSASRRREQAERTVERAREDQRLLEEYELYFNTVEAYERDDAGWHGDA